MSLVARARCLVATLRRASYCRIHDRIHASDFCPECMTPRLERMEVVEAYSRPVKPEWSWPLERDEEGRLVIHRIGSAQPPPSS